MVDYTDYDEYPKALARDDFWGQVRRTIRGRRITEEELAVVVRAIRSGLQLSSDDVLLDLMCGNGALTARLFDSCQSVIGVDRSKYLIEIAKEYFERAPQYRFVEAEALAYVRVGPEAQRFTKMLCYGAFQYLPFDVARLILSELRLGFASVERILLGNLPDKERADRFFRDRLEQERPDLGDAGSQIGVWWAQEELREVAGACGWRASFSQLPSHVFNAHYRYDAVLVPSD
jgi:SAM-dependent methyltransferase